MISEGQCLKEPYSGDRRPSQRTAVGWTCRRLLKHLPKEQQTLIGE